MASKFKFAESKELEFRSGSLSPVSHKWTCTSCQMKNNMHNHKCTFCGTIKPHMDISYPKQVIDDSLIDQLVEEIKQDNEKTKNENTNDEKQDLNNENSNPNLTPKRKFTTNIDEARFEFDKGWKSSLFENKMAANYYKCGICRNIALNAVELSCKQPKMDDHAIVYCKLCLENQLFSNSNICPINPDHHNVSYNGNRTCRKSVNNLIIWCPRSMRGQGNDQDHKQLRAHYCDWKGKLLKLTSHLKNDCKFKLIDCPYQWIGCDRSNILNHKESNLCQHIDLLNNALLKYVSELKDSNSEIRLLQRTVTTQNALIISLKKENEKIWNTMDKKSNKNNQSLNKASFFHSGGCNFYHPTKIRNKMEGHPTPTQLITFHPIKASEINKKYHPGTLESKHMNVLPYNNQFKVYSCCRKQENSVGCQNKKVWNYKCCGALKNKDEWLFNQGCSKKYKCCSQLVDDAKSKGCLSKPFYPCCDRLKGEEGCSMRYECCNLPYPNSKGCKIVS